MQDYLGTAWGGLDWGVCAGCECVDIACRCVSVVVAGADVDVAGVAVDVAGAAADVAGVAVDVAGAAADVAGAAAKKRKVLVRVEGGVVVRVRQAAGATGMEVIMQRASEEVADPLPTFVVLAAAAERLDVGGSGSAGRVIYRRRYSYLAGGPVLVLRVIPDVCWSFAHDVRLVNDSNRVLAKRVAADNARDAVLSAAAAADLAGVRRPTAGPNAHGRLRASYIYARSRFLCDVRIHLLARTDAAAAAVSADPSLWADDYWMEQRVFPSAQLSAFVRLADDGPRDRREAVVWDNLTRHCRIIRSQGPVFEVTGSTLAPLSAWRMVAVAFAGAEVGCRSAEEHRRWIWLVRCVQGAAPVFCPPRLAGLALLAGNRQQLRGLLACWVGESGNFSGAANLLHVTNAVAWLHMRPSADNMLGSLVPRVNLREVSVVFPARLILIAVRVSQRVPLFNSEVLLGGACCTADCDYVDVGRAYDLSPLVDSRRRVRSDVVADSQVYSSDLPLGAWDTAYHHGVLAAVPWVLGFVDRSPVALDDAGVFAPAVEEGDMGEE